jgi:hypothetical protein
MNLEQHRAIHNSLDGAGPPPPGSEAAAQLRRYEETLAALEGSRQSAPADLADRIMERVGKLPPHGRPSAWQRWLPAPRQWLVPALGGAAAVVLIGLAGLFVRYFRTAATETATVRFELRAPGAHKVELVGTFNEWRPGAIELKGPDASGHWETTVELSEGRYEYLFLVDGRKWVVDPAARVVRPDGFGKVNAVIEVSGEGITL